MEKTSESWTRDIKETIVILSMIGTVKKSLPLNLRGWLNDLGLFVQLNEKSLSNSIYEFHTLETLQAGGRIRHCLVAEQHRYSGQTKPAWQVIKYDQKTWESQFAHLVIPTAEIAYIISFASAEQFTKEQGDICQKVIHHYKNTGEWLGLFEYVFTKERVLIEQCFWKASIYVASGKYDEAYSELTNVTNLNNISNSKADAYFRRATLLVLMGKESEAITDFSTVISISENPSTTMEARQCVVELLAKRVKGQVYEELGIKDHVPESLKPISRNEKDVSPSTNEQISHEYIEQKLSPEFQPLIQKVLLWVEQDYPQVEQDKLDTMPQISKSIEHMRDDMSSLNIVMEIVDHIHSAIEKKSYREAMIFDLLLFLILEYERKVIDIEMDKRPKHNDKLDEIYRKQMEYQANIFGHVTNASKESQDWEALFLAAGHFILLDMEKPADEKIIQFIRDKIGEDAMRNRISNMIKSPQSIIDIYFGKILISHLDKTQSKPAEPVISTASPLPPLPPLSRDIDDSAARECFVLANELEGKGKKEKAIEQYTKAIRLNSHHTTAYFRRGILLMEMNYKPAALADFKRVVEFADNPELTDIAKANISKLSH